MAIQALLVILAVLLVLLFLGVPISYAIAVSSLTAILSSIDLNVAVLTAAQRTFVGMSKFSLTAIPFFILAGNIMNQGGIAKRLVDFVMAILGKLPGALLVTNIGTNALFGAISGSASAAAAAVGSMIRDGAEEQGYDRRDRCHQCRFLLLRFADPAVQRLDHLLSGIRRHLCGCAVHGRLHPRHHLGAVLLRGGRAAGDQAGL